ncbi:MAG: S9 family peptidase [Chlorobi bacterium]|nr:S9 family peptidase [Chlorobiota bacterium]
MKFKLKAYKNLLFLFIVFFSFINLYSQTEKPKITLEDLWKKYTFYPSSVYGLRSMNNGLYYTTIDKASEINKYSYKTGKKVSTILNINELDTAVIKSLNNYEFSDNESKIIFYINRERIYRRSFTADFYVWDLETKKLMKVSDRGRQQLATLSPDGSKVAFVRNNNIYIKNLISGVEKAITKDGKYNEIINGAPDWVYEEEFSFAKAFAWSPDGEKIAFYKFDESKVKQFDMTMFYDLYPENRQYKYPKAGEDNSIVNIFVYNLLNERSLKMNTGKETDQYIPRIKWTNNSNILSIQRLNRLQNKLDILLADVTNGKSEVVFTDTNKYYVDITDFVSFIENNRYFIYVGEIDGYNHIYLYDLEQKKLKQITKGKWDVTNYLGYDSKNKLFYYTSAEESPLRRSVYTIDFNGNNKKKLSEKDGMNRTEFSKGFKYYINYYSNATTPAFITLHNAKGKLIRILEDNKPLLDTLQFYNYSTKEFFSFTTSENVLLNGYMIKPPDFDKNKKYPVFMTQYSGPNSQEVLDNWSFNWENYLAQEGYIVVCVDGRGTGARGEEFRKMTYLQLGKYETIDQIEAAKYLGTLPYVDKDRIGIFGWSYGGFMSLLCMTKGADYFKAGIAVAPVTNWRYYDNIYTERFMRTPQENPDGYDNNSPINFVDSLKGKLLIVHGSGDDNVHLQNTMMIAEKLIQANKQFDMMIYPNKNHSIYGGNTRYHLFTKMVDFLKENL